MSNTTKTSLGLDLIDISSEKLIESRVKISSNFQLIDDLFKSDVFDTRYYTKEQTGELLTEITDNHYDKTNIDNLLSELYTKEEINIFNSGTNDDMLHAVIKHSTSLIENLEYQSIFNKFVESLRYDRVGEIITTSGKVPFSDCLIADGRILNRDDYPKLFDFATNSENIVDDKEWTIRHEFSYSYGNGTTTFRIPNYQGKFMKGMSSTDKPLLIINQLRLYTEPLIPHKMDLVNGLVMYCIKYK